MKTSRHKITEWSTLVLDKVSKVTMIKQIPHRTHSIGIGRIAKSQQITTGDDTRYRVLHLVEPTFAGVRRHVVDLVIGLSREYPNQLELHLGYSERRADRAFEKALPELAASGVKRHNFDFAHSIEPFNDFKGLYHVIRYIHKHRIDMVHTHSSKAGFLGRLAALLTVRPTIYTPHASPYRLSRKYFLLESLAGRYLSDAVIAVSPSERNELITNRVIPAERLHRIYCGIPEYKQSTAFATETELFRQQLYQSHAQNADKPLIIGTMGRISAQKAPLRFAEIAYQAIQQNPRLHFVWIGDGDLRNTLEDTLKEYQIEQRVHITGWQENVDRYLSAFDVFILPSDYESFGYATVEAMRAGIPCIVSNVAGSRDVVADSNTGFVIDDPSDVNSYVNAIVRLANSESLRNQMGVQGKARWQAMFHVDRMVQETFQLYRQLLPQRRHQIRPVAVDRLAPDLEKL